MSINHNAHEHTPQIKVGNIPEELKALNQWVNWAGIWNAEKEKFSKPPMRANGRNASSTKPKDWTTLEKSLAARSGRGLRRLSPGRAGPHGRICASIPAAKSWRQNGRALPL